MKKERERQHALPLDENVGVDCKIREFQEIGRREELGRLQPLCGRKLDSVARGELGEFAPPFENDVHSRCRSVDCVRT